MCEMLEVFVHYLGNSGCHGNWRFGPM